MERIFNVLNFNHYRRQPDRSIKYKYRCKPKIYQVVRESQMIVCK